MSVVLSHIKHFNKTSDQINNIKRKNGNEFLNKMCEVKRFKYVRPKDRFDKDGHPNKGTFVMFLEEYNE